MCYRVATVVSFSVHGHDHGHSGHAHGHSEHEHGHSGEDHGHSGEGHGHGHHEHGHGHHEHGHGDHEHGAESIFSNMVAWYTESSDDFNNSHLLSDIIPGNPGLKELLGKVLNQDLVHAPR